MIGCFIGYEKQVNIGYVSGGKKSKLCRYFMHKFHVVLLTKVTQCVFLCVYTDLQRRHMREVPSSAQ